MYRNTLNLKINQERCTRCGICINECVNEVLIRGNDGFPAADPDGGTDRCIHCRHCLMVCPERAFSMDETDPDLCPETGGYPAADQMVNLIRGRRSIRHFKQENVSKDTIAGLLSAMKYVPTGVNHRSLHFSVIDDIEVMNQFRKRLYDRLLERINAGEAADYASLKDRILRGLDPVFRTAPHLLLVSVSKNAPCRQIDPVIALSYFELLANTAGLGTLWCGRVINVMNDVLPEFYQILRVPESCQPGYAMLFGYAGSEFLRTVEPEAAAVTVIQRLP